MPPVYQMEMLTTTMAQVRHRAEWHLYIFRIWWDSSARKLVLINSAQVIPNDQAAFDYQSLYQGAYDFARQEALNKGLIDP